MPLWQGIVPFPLGRGRHQAVVSPRTPGPSRKAPRLCPLRHQEAEPQRGPGTTGHCRRANTSFYKQALHEPRRLTRRDRPVLPACGRCLAGLCRRARPLPAAPARPAPRPDWPAPLPGPALRDPAGAPGSASSLPAKLSVDGAPLGAVPQPPQPAGSVPPAGSQRRPPGARCAASRAPSAPAREALRERGMAREGLPARWPCWGGPRTAWLTARAANQRPGARRSGQWWRGGGAAPGRWSRLGLGRRRQRLLLAWAARVGVKELLAWAGVAIEQLRVRGSLGRSLWGGLWSVYEQDSQACERGKQQAGAGVWQQPKSAIGGISPEVALFRTWLLG